MRSGRGPGRPRWWRSRPARSGRRRASRRPRPNSPQVEAVAAVAGDGAQRAGDAGEAHGLPDGQRAVRAELAGSGKGVDEMAGQRQHDGRGEALLGQFDGRRQHLLERQPAVALVQGEPAVDGARHLHAADVAPHRHRRHAVARACRSGSDPAPARPMERSASGGDPGGATIASTSPPSPHRCGPTTAMAVPVATAASAAEPPCASIPRPADAASWSAAATMPRRPVRGPKGARGRDMPQE